MQEIEDEKEAEELTNKLRKTIGAWGTTSLTLDQLRKIVKVIENK